MMQVRYPRDSGVREQSFRSRTPGKKSHSLTRPVPGCAAIPVEIGALPLPRDPLVQALNTQALTLLCPPPVGGPLSISFKALQSAPGKPVVPHIF